MSLVAMLKGTGKSGFGYGTSAQQATEGLDLSRKTMLLTGCNSGIGAEMLRVLVMRGAHVIGAARTLDKARGACAVVEGKTTPVCCELSEPDSVRACVIAVQQLGVALDAIICNAGIMALPKLQQKHGYELQFLTNHIGHFILVDALLGQLAESGRVVMVSSSAHRAAPREGIQFDNLSGGQGYGPWRAYGQSKLANLLYARELARRLHKPLQTANAVHPGVIHTNLARHMNPLVDVGYAIAGPLVFKNMAQGAATQCYVAAHPAIEGVSGKYFADCNEARSSKLGRDEQLAARLWEVSEQIVAGL